MKYLVIGGGAHARVLIDVLKCGGDNTIIGVTDPNIEPGKSLLCEVPVLGNDSTIEKYSPESVLLVNGIGAKKNTVLRKEIFKKWKARGYRFPPVIHPNAFISPRAFLDEGVQVMAGVVINVGVRIGENAIINTNSAIDHDCQIESHVFIAPGVTLCGRVTVAEGAFLGAGSTVLQNIEIGKEATVAAGAVVIEDVAPKTMVKGIPARP